jgi:hypothetical protein
MIKGHPPRHRLLVSPDTKPEERGGILLPSSFVAVTTGTVVQSGVDDIPVGSHVSWDSTLPSLPEIEIEEKGYLSIHEKDIKLIHQKH